MQFLFLSLFFLNVLSASTETSPANVLRQSATFLSTLTNADPGIVNKMIDMVTDLEKQGQDEKKDLNARAHAQWEIEMEKKRELEAAQENMEEAVAEFERLTGLVGELSDEEATKRALLLAATNNRDAAEKNANDAKDSMISITNRVREEKEAFKKVLDLLDSVIVPKGLLTIGRSLLTSDAADPDAVAAIKKQVVDLDEAADKEASDSVEANQNAQNLFLTRQKEFDSASHAHTSVAGALKEATESLIKATTARDNAVTAEGLAQTALFKEWSKSVEINKFRDAETIRIDKEAIALSQTKELLKTLL